MTDDRAQRDTPALPYQPPRLPDLSAPAFGGTDLVEHFRRLEEITRRRADRQAAPSTLFLPDFVTLAAEDSLDLGDLGEDLLEDARANIARGEYALALEQLAEFLELSPGRSEARYLQAYCHYRLGDLMTALEITLPMRHERLDDPAVRKGVLDLRATLCDVLTPVEVGTFLDTRHRDPRAADDRLRRFIDVAPEQTEPPYLLALLQAVDGDYVSAFHTARNAADRADGDVAHLRALADALALLAVRPLSKDVVRALYDGAYQRARKALARLDRQWRELEMLRDLDGFLAQLTRTNRSPSKPLPAPNIPADRATRLYALIADLHREEALDLVDARRWAEAERVLAEILRVVPAYPPPNLLYAFCLLSQGKEPERAIAAAEVAARDPELPEAKALLRTAKQLREVLAINAAFEEHNNAVGRVGSPPTREQLITLRRSMEQLRGRLPKLAAMATTRDSTRRVRELGQAVTKQVREIDLAMADLEVSALVERFNEWARQLTLGWPVGSPGRSDRLEGELIAAEAERLKATHPHARQLLQQMINGIDRARRFR
ncbi:hypothetical protein [Amycolatopsis sp. SID8362]|uniref:hypothetical protein n=1 Tax=Amycolatopsis sp. SID8362 TaxID=2690346 RepID=UPI00136C27D7|nr:hypothetical protein [Amycolatopsis sp. SID8362]NBH12103.1 hypothetical protein [Amycolatopsis sp. SID8362]NED48795.1 hypothetical protein [Amycolatopsis sp. SID8362]